MSLLSQGEKALMSALTNGMHSILGALTIDPNTKEAITSSLTGAVSTIETEAATAGTAIVEDTGAAIAGALSGGDVAITGPALVASQSGEPLLTVVENDVAQVAENLVDAAITKVTGPLAPEAITIANALLSMLGGDAEAAIASLFHAKSAPAEPTVGAVTAAVSPH